MLLIFATEPRPGTVKLGLCPPLNPVQAAMLSEAMLHDSLAGLAGLEGVKRVVCFSPDSLPGFASGDFAWLRQAGADLGERLDHAFRQAFAAGANQVLACATDHPTLPVERISQAFAALERSSVVMGPADGGGCYLLGSSRYLPSLFESVSWEGPFVAEALRRVCQALGLALNELPGWYGVEQPADLTRLRRELAKNPEKAPITAAFLASLP